MPVALWWVYFVGFLGTELWLFYRVAWQKLVVGERFAFMAVVRVPDEESDQIGFRMPVGRRSGIVTGPPWSFLMAIVVVVLFAMVWLVSVPAELIHNHRLRKAEQRRVADEAMLTWKARMEAERWAALRAGPEEPEVVGGTEDPWPPYGLDPEDRDWDGGRIKPTVEQELRQRDYLDREFGPDTGGTWRGPRSGS